MNKIIEWLEQARDGLPSHKFEKEAQAFDDAIAVIEAADTLIAALTSTHDATGAYLPPDGISAGECLNRILGATDNTNVCDALTAYRNLTQETPNAG